MAPKKSKIQSGTRGGKQLGMKDMFKRIVVNIAIPDPSSWQSLQALVGQVIDKAYSDTFRYLSHGVLDSGSRILPVQSPNTGMIYIMRWRVEAEGP